jgi:hypothetical protein
MILLVGEQPAPNLLPARYLGPDLAILVHTDRTAGVARNLKSLLEPRIRCEMCKVPPYSITDAFIQLDKCLATKASGHEYVFNLTGGTKTMVLATFDLAHRLDSPFVYFRSEGNQSLLYRYRIAKGGIVQESQPEEIGETITLSDYLKMYLGEYTEGPPRDPLEGEVKDVLDSIDGLEVKYSVRPSGMEALEVDFIVRFGNQVGVGEVKRKGAKKGIDQINAVADPRYLGTYVKKFLISGKEVDRNNRNLAKAYRIKVVELPSFLQRHRLSEADRQKLKEAILSEMGGR